MRLVSFLNGYREQGGIVLNEKIFPFQTLHPVLPDNIDDMLEDWSYFMLILKEMENELRLNDDRQQSGLSLNSLQLLAPILRPGSLRDGYAFRQHVETARRNRGLAMTSVFDEFPVFYFGNHRTVIGPGELRLMPDHFDKLDYELEVAIVIGKSGKNIRASEADKYIAGLMVMNDFSARKLQVEEMLLNLGPAKGKDFATTTGPFLVTPDELSSFETSCKDDHIGKAWNLNMSASVNGTKMSSGNLADMEWTFAELIERASYGVDLYPGDIIGSGTVGTGCLLELNGTGRLNNPGYQERWLQPDDEITLTVEGLGTLVNTVVKDSSDFSILGQKKKNNSA